MIWLLCPCHAISDMASFQSDIDHFKNYFNYSYKKANPSQSTQKMTEASKKYVKYQGAPTAKPVFVMMHEEDIMKMAPTMDVKGSNCGGQVQAATTKLWDEGVKSGQDVHYKHLEEDMQANIVHLCFNCYFVLMFIQRSCKLC